MRRSLVILLCALAAAPAALAATTATGDGVLELKSAYGTVRIGAAGQPARGVLWGQMDKGKLIVVDPLLGDGQIYVSGWEKKSLPTVNDSGATVVTYWGTNIHFRVAGGKYRLIFNGQGIDLTAVGVGVAYLDGSDTADDAGYYAVDSGKWIPMPMFGLTPVPFGTPPAATP